MFFCCCFLQIPVIHWLTGCTKLFETNSSYCNSISIFRVTHLCAQMTRQNRPLIPAGLCTLPPCSYSSWLVHLITLKLVLCSMFICSFIQLWSARLCLLDLFFIFNCTHNFAIWSWKHKCFHVEESVLCDVFLLLSFTVVTTPSLGKTLTSTMKP